MTRRLAIDRAARRDGQRRRTGVVRTNLRATSAEAVGDLIDLQRGVGTSTDKMDWLIRWVGPNGGGGRRCRRLPGQ